MKKWNQFLLLLGLAVALGVASGFAYAKRPKPKFERRYLENTKVL